MAELPGGSYEGRTGAPPLEPMSDDALRDYLWRRAQNALNNTDNELSERRQTLLDRYLGEELGNEEEGFSQLRTREVLETIEWATAGLMRIVTSVAPFAAFEPVAADDVAGAKMESEILHTFIMERNPGWAELRAWAKDWLLYPNGYIKVWRDDSLTPTVTPYQGLAYEEALLLASYLDPAAGEGIVRFEATPDGLFDVDVQRLRSEPRLRVKCVPPEEVLVDDNASALSLDEADFVCHYGEPSRSDLIGQGYDADQVYRLPTANRLRLSTEREARRDTTDEDVTRADEQGADVRVEVYECYVKVDYDGDGLSEMRKVVFGGKEILENRPIDMQPIVAMSALPQTHRHVGLSEGEIAVSIQDAQTALIRELMNNCYRVNSPRTFIGPGVNRDQMETYVPGGMVECEDVDQTKPELIQTYVKDILPVIQHLDDELAGRTGISKQLTALDPDVLAKTTVGAYMTSMGMASQRLEMLAREWAESGLKLLALKMHHLMRTNASDSRGTEIQIRGQFVPINPAVWRTRTDMTVKVGLGTGNVQERISSGMAILEMQKEALPFGLTTKARVYNTLAELCEAFGRRIPERYFLDPESPEGIQVAEQMAAQEAEQTQQQLDMLAAQVTLEEKRLLLEQMKLSVKQDIEAGKLEHDYVALELEHGADIPGVGLEGNVTPLRREDAAD